MRIAILAGDGIGPEVTAQAVKVLRALSANNGPQSRWRRRRSATPATSAGDPLPPARAGAGARRPTPSCSAPPASYEATCGHPESARRARPAAAAQGARPVRQFPPGLAFPELHRRLHPEARGDRGRRPRGPARADRRHLFRRRRAAAPSMPNGERERHQHHALHRSRDRPHPHVGFQAARKRRKQALLGGQGQCAGDQRALARGGERGRRATTRMSSSATYTSMPRRCT